MGNKKLNKKNLEEEKNMYSFTNLEPDCVKQNSTFCTVNTVTIKVSPGMHICTIVQMWTRTFVQLCRCVQQPAPRAL